MRLPLLAMLALSACRKPAPVEPAPPSAAEAQPPAQPSPSGPLAHLFWSTVADADGPLVQVRQTATGSDRCHVSASVADRESWSADACLATRSQLRFLSPDGDALLVLDPGPEVENEPPAGVRIGTLFRRGAPVAQLTPSALQLPYGALRIEGGKLRWLGPRDQRARSEGIEVQLADGSVRLLRFDGAGLPRPAAPRPRPTQGAEPKVATFACSPCAYTDDQGVYHLEARAEDIPARYRTRAAGISGVVNRADAAPVSAAPAETTMSSNEAALPYGTVPWKPLPVEPPKPPRWPGNCNAIDNLGQPRPCSEEEQRAADYAESEHFRSRASFGRPGF
jgi:hypothetical protein